MAVLPLGLVAPPPPVGPHSLPAWDKSLRAPYPPPIEAEGEPLPWGASGPGGVWPSWGVETGCSKAVDSTEMRSRV